MLWIIKPNISVYKIQLKSRTPEIKLSQLSLRNVNYLQGGTA
jgi:hypothetical protein